MRLGAALCARIEKLSRELARADPRLSATRFADLVRSGVGEGPVFVLNDHEGVALFEHHGGAGLEYRLLFLAGDGDVLAISSPRHRLFEEYCRETLETGEVEVAHVPSCPGRSFARSCRVDARLVDRLVDLAGARGGLTILPYMGTHAVWSLADDIARRAGSDVCVAAPPPRLAQRVNDKLWFLQRVEEVLGQRSLPSTFPAFGPAALTAKVMALARESERVAIKLPDSAGSAGNVVLDAERVRELSARVLREFILGTLRHLGWSETFPLAVEVWEGPVVFSPSVQLWIPRLEDGLPVVEGIFEQIVEGVAGEFVGAEPLDAPSEWTLRLATEAVLLGSLFQRLGYFGRCSLDAIIVGTDLADHERTELHWVECNGRWGGVSIPMTLVNRLIDDDSVCPFVVVQKESRSIRPGSFAASLDTFRDRLYARGRSPSGAVFLSPTRLETGTGIDFVMLAKSREAARKQARALLRELASGAV